MDDRYKFEAICERMGSWNQTALTEIFGERITKHAKDHTRNNATLHYGEEGQVIGYTLHDVRNKKSVHRKGDGIGNGQRAGETTHNFLRGVSSHMTNSAHAGPVGTTPHNIFNL